MTTLPSLLACAVCMPDQGTPVADATTSAIFFMIGIIGVVLSLILGLIIKFAIRQRRAARLAEMTLSPT